MQTLFPVKPFIARVKRTITVQHVAQQLPCTFERVKQIFLSGLQEDSKEYQRLLARLDKAWNKAIDQRALGNWARG